MDPVQILTLIAECSGVPGLSAAANLLEQIYLNVQQVKLHQDDCKNLRDRCVTLIINLNESLPGLEGTRMSAAIDEVTFVLQRVAKKTREWKDRGFIRQFIRNDSFGNDIVRLNSQLDTSIQKFQNTTMVHIVKEEGVHTQLLLQLISRAENVEALVQEIKANRVTKEQTEDLMESLQQDLSRMQVSSPQKVVLGKGLSAVSEASGDLPPLVDLTGQVRKTDPQSVGGGSSSDVWKGVAWETRRVAIKGLRDHKATPERIQRLVKEAELWRNLKHDNVLPCFGLARDQCPTIALVSPWMENQSSVNYIQKNPGCDRRRILRGTARGLEYLHRNSVVHGDLRGSNILIDGNGDAKICDFGLAAVGSDNIGSTSIAATAARWMAPEMMSGQVLPGAPSDVFSFGRTILEIMTGKKPFAEMRNAFQIVTDVCARKNPRQPMEPEVIARGLNDDVWKFCLRCWQFQPEARPGMQQVLQETESLLWAP